MRKQYIRSEERKSKEASYEEMIRHCRVNARAAFRRKPYDIRITQKGGEMYDHKKETYGNTDA